MDRKKSNVAQLWKQYKTENDLRSRDELVNIYAPLVKIVAGRLAMHMPSNVELDDLEGYGAFGLLDAVEKFDPNREIKFETYASTRIRGSIIDGLRSADWVPRSVRNKARRLENSTQELIQTLGRNPT